jgi:site-specific DNA-methyltransferase (cytosine-N4-specific)
MPAPKVAATNPSPPKVAYKTALGICINGLAEKALSMPLLAKFRGKVDLIFTSPPFPLNRKKKYDNLTGQAYVDWLSGFADLFNSFLSPTGSIVMEVGNSWEPGKPVMSTLALEALLGFHRKGKLNLCQQFVWHNPARLPSPAQWVTIERIRLKDSYTHLWWMSPTTRPKADNRQILRPYSDSMRSLLKTGKYNSGRRPSEHQIGEASFLKDNRGAIPSNHLKFPEESAQLTSNVIEMANTQAGTKYQNYCRDHGLEPHPARMPSALAEFFIKFLTSPGDLVLDPFGGSNTTGAAAEKLSRRWVCIEPVLDYIEGSRGRFTSTKGNHG